MKISKKYEKNVDQSTRSCSIVTRWAFRLLVLLVMITTIFSIFVVPASASDPFQGFELFDFKYLNYVSPSRAFSESDIVYNPLPSDHRFNSYLGYHISYPEFIIEFYGLYPEFNIEFLDLSQMVYNNYSDFPFLRCSSDVVVFDGKTNALVVPAGELITEYIFRSDVVFDESSGIRRIYRDGSNVGSDGLHSFVFEINPTGISFLYEDGIRSVFDVIANWIGNTFFQLSSIFFADGSLTFVGILCVASLAFGVILLLFSIISRFLRFGG